MTTSSRVHVQHPGPPAALRYCCIPANAHRKHLQLKKGDVITSALAHEMDKNGADSAVILLDGCVLSSAFYFIPAKSKGPEHAAWYSERLSALNIQIDYGTAIVGRKENQWFLHCHAMWHDRQNQQNYAGHLLADESVLGENCIIDIILLTSGTFETAFDPETNFTLFHLIPRQKPTPKNAALITIRPHEDLRATINVIAAESGIRSGRLFGIGSLVGAAFHDAPSMPPPLSEILLLNGASIKNGQCAALPLACVNENGEIFSGDLKNGSGPVLVTAELILIED